MLPTYTLQIDLNTLRTEGENKQILFENSYFRIIKMTDHLEMECLGERTTNKRDLSTLAIFFRKHSAITGNNKVLLSLPGIWALDMSAWDLIRNKDFFGNYFIAFIATELYQNLLLRGLERSNHNIKIFRTKELATEWLETKDTKQRYFA